MNIEDYKYWILNHAKPVGNSRLSHLKCGVHSGFPWHCILFYIFVYLTLFRYNLYHLYIDKIPHHYGYIHCPFCVLFKKSPVKINHCKCWFGTQKNLKKLQEGILDGSIKFEREKL